MLPTKLCRMLNRSSISWLTRTHNIATVSHRNTGCKYQQKHFLTTYFPTKLVNHNANQWTISRTFSVSSKLNNGDDAVRITYIDREGEEHTITGKVGDNAMYLAHHHDLDIEGACEASLACCTCHVYVEKDFYDKLPEPEEEEEDMLDLAPFLQENSRLSCQIILEKDLDGIVLRLPTATRNFYVDGHKPSHH